MSAAPATANALASDAGAESAPVSAPAAAATAATGNGAESGRGGKELILATRPFASESAARSWWYLSSTFAVLGALAAAAALAPYLALRILSSVALGLVLVRAFILMHDHLHGAMLHGSRLADVIFAVFGASVLTPIRVWRRTHNYHHAHTAKIVGSQVGSYPMLTVDQWLRATPMQRLGYRVVRHPLNILFGVVTVFLFGMCIAPLVRNPKQNWDAAPVLALQGLIALVAIHYFGIGFYFLVVALPLTVACATGGYLFYAQHNFPDMHLQRREEWEYARAALESSSYMEVGPLMAWLTGDIGYHHVHHLNPAIPFYRLAETMAALPELQNPPRTSLALRDIEACFRLNLWDSEQKRMIAFPPSHPGRA